MPLAVGVIQTNGFPPVIAAADAMVKSGRVTLVYFGLAERAEFLVAVRGPTAEVRQAVAAGIQAAQATPPGDRLVSHYIVPNPPENVESVMPIDFTPLVDAFRF
ncbi:MAG TPA: carbon dioxide-concentrating mechanism protein CcmK [Leptolyngbyaceae cyanobacterium M33_DOE_097]|uniref:Carboxysome shell protein CcmK n=1 Tax=Oscillatoriales cyanobacterium SpSt-418 TaxID=2282169 RepID=A0A7C3KHB0_9CYAN|nr:carbon dioxide-concentrating mechanism protein CcmK [Leptolyngbyaceae cyanobacterium M33_DOE_097]